MNQDQMLVDRVFHPFSNHNVVMLSGGLDSVLSWAYLGAPDCIHVNLGMPYSVKEFAAVDNLQKKWGFRVKYVTIHPPLPQQARETVTEENPFIPARNLMLATFGAQSYEWICIGGVKGDRVEDKTPEAYAEMSLLLTKQTRKQVTVFSPLWHMTKAQAVAWFIDKGNPIQLLRDSISCYYTDIRYPQCGNCGSCFRKWIALARNGVDPKFPLSTAILREYNKKMASGLYDEERVRETDDALRYHSKKVTTAHTAGVPDYFPPAPYAIVYKT